MDAEEFIRNVFGEDVFAIESPPVSTKQENLNESKTFKSIQLVEKYIKFTLASRTTQITNIKTDNRPGRIGPKVVKFDISSHHGVFIVSPNRLSINSQTNFSTMKANTAAFKGKWFYELQLGSKGVMQVGWCTSLCKFNKDSGVGDTPYSYAYDGNRVRKWNVSSEKYGEPWLSGDIIGCALDLNAGAIDFYRNGKHLGRAFDNVATGPGVIYYPAVSLSFTENLTANFGDTPFRYPLEGYNTFHLPPKEQATQAVLLFKWFSHLLNVLHEFKSTNKHNTLMNDETMTICTFLMCLMRSVMKYIGPMTALPYVVEATFVPFIQNLCLQSESVQIQAIGSNKSESKLIMCLDLLWTHLDEHEIKSCLESTIMYLLSVFRHVSLVLEYTDQRKSLITLTRICEHTVTRQHLLQSMLFDRVRFVNFVHVKPLDISGLGKVVEKVWWETNPVDPSIESNKEIYFQTCERIRAAISDVETLQINLLVTLLTNADGTNTTATSRTIFLRKFRRFIQENLVSNRTPLPITLCCFYRLLVTFRKLWDAEVGTSPVHIPCRVFYDASINYQGIDRLGGVLSHLNKTFKKELIELLGSEHEVITAMEQNQETSSNIMGGASRQNEFPMLIPAFARMINLNSSAQGNSTVLERLGGYFSNIREDKTPLRLGTRDSAVSLLELLDGIILFYHVAAKKQVAKVAVLRDSMSDYIRAIAHTKDRLDIINNFNDKQSRSIQKELMRSLRVFDEKLSDQSRNMAWIRAAVYSEEKQSHLAWLLRVITFTLKLASGEGNLFSFVPDFYLETLADICISLRSHLHPTTPIHKIQDYKEMLLDVADFLCNHFLDSRIVNSNCRDNLLLMLAGFVSNPLTLEALENVPREGRLKVVTNLLKPYENRAWAQSNWILVRFWQGNGLAFRYDKSPHLSKKVGPKLLNPETVSQSPKPYPSTIYQQHVKEILINNSQLSALFLNSLLNQLNWAFSEFIGMIQEIHNVSSRPERVFIESRQLKICATCFDLAVSLLRVLEMICAVAPTIFNDPRNQSSSENLLARLCQLLCQVLNRMSSQTSCFQHVVLLEIPDLESVDHFPILAAVIGILLALLKEDVETANPKLTNEVPKVTRTLLTEPSFQMSSLYFVLGDTQLKNNTIKNIKPFSFLNYETDVDPEEIFRIRIMIDHLELCNSLLPESKLIIDDDDTCTICYAFPIAATFKPCNHQSCRSCIDRHLLNTRKCFFCKTTIDKVVDLSDNVLHYFIDDDESVSTLS